MKKLTKEHFEMISLESMREWIENDAFSVYAQSSNESKSDIITLGVDGYGVIIVKTKSKNYYFSFGNLAIEKYKELILK